MNTSHRLKVLLAALGLAPTCINTNLGAAGTEQLVSANTAFGFHLFRQMTEAHPGENVFISPYSVSSALQMVANGAAGETKAEMQKMLQTQDMDPALLNGAVLELDKALLSRTDVILNIANGVWYQEGSRLKPAFQKANRDFFRAQLAAVDFASPDAAKRINDWAEKQTSGRIHDVVQFPFPPRTRMVLADAIYFKGQWATAFNTNATVPKPFYRPNDAGKTVPMMTESGRFRYRENTDYQAVCLPYRGGLQMELYLPTPGSSPAKLLEKCQSQDEAAGMRRQFNWREGTVTLPKFKMEFEVNLKEPLQALGMKAAFGAADFSEMAEEPLVIGKVVQKSFVEVNEAGTEAAAVTTVHMVKAAVRMPAEKPFTMILDRPFFFLIADVSTGAILFMGLVEDPRSAR